VQRSQAEEIRVLGPLEIVGEQGAAAALAPKERQLFAALLVEAGSTRSSDVLVDALWGASPPRSAPALLHVYVSKLRKVLPASVRIRTQGSGYALELEDGVLDAARFERLLAEGREAAGGGNPTLAASLLQRALALWRGQAYGDLAYEEFARTEAERLEELRLAALEERIEADLELGRHVELLPELGNLASANPLRERLQAQAMLAFYRSGRQSEALERYAAARRHLHDELGLEPGAELRSLQRRILQHDPTLYCAPADQEPMGASLPTPPNPLLGRERELAELGALLRRNDVRLLVLTGAGGSGKTRLAFEAARQCARLFANGAAFVELAPVHDPDLLVSAISSALGIEQVGGEQLETLIAALRPREILLLLDNLEHLREAAVVLVDLVSQAPRLTLLVTSRVVLHLSGEHVYPIEPLGEEDAVALFLVRAREAHARFDPDASAQHAIRRICERLDGLPLAIELAAGRIRTRTPAELLAGLEQHVPLLTGGPRDLPARQQTLRATLEWSFDLLDALERRDLARLSVFAGGCTLESAEAVCDTTLERLSSLVDHNLVLRTVEPHGSRYSMLETIRQFALERLEESGEADALRRRHAERMLAIAQAAHLSEDDDEPFDQSIALMEREDLRAALDWAIGADVLLGVELSVALENFWSAHAPAEGVRRIGDLLGRDVAIPQRLRARALRVLAGAAHQERAFNLADPCYEESLRIFTELGDRRGIASLRTRLAYRAFGKGNAQVARRLIDDSQSDARNRFPLIDAQNTLLLAHLALADGRLDDANVLLHHGREVASDLRWAWWEANTLTVLLDVALRRGDPEEAERHGRAALAIDVEQEHAVSAVHAIAGLARAALARGDLERAGMLWGAVSDRGRGEWAGPSARWRDELSEETRPGFVAAFARGRALEMWDAAAIALADGETPRTVP
jgi:predicted ATPase/DNA-binding SARP family transcriptional activator